MQMKAGMDITGGLTMPVPYAMVFDCHLLREAKG
jgi:hypothetical protein